MSLAESTGSEKFGRSNQQILIGVYEKSGRGSSCHFCFYHNNTFAKSWFCRIPFSLLR